ncbi:hypothetical protein Tcan_00733, partial [Toxocara canis]
ITTSSNASSFIAVLGILLCSETNFTSVLFIYLDDRHPHFAVILLDDICLSVAKQQNFKGETQCILLCSFAAYTGSINKILILRKIGKFLRCTVRRIFERRHFSVNCPLILFLLVSSRNP